MSKEDLLKFDGVVTESFSGNRFRVKLPNGRELMAKLSGKLRRFHIRILVGDRVTIGLSPYDLSHGLILAREKLTSYAR
ncbi:MAG: translation initiation factor IF-1 [Deltaproteobacteria bacterium]|nr:translation initiation factor IF-1 [Deltaproteobacteria bacterium]